MIKVVVPQEDLDKIEEARVALYKLLDELDISDSIYALIQITKITQPMWDIANRKYPKTLSCKLRSLLKTRESE